MPGNRRLSERERRRAEERAMLKVTRAEMNPLEVAAENQNLRNAVNGQDLILRALTARGVNRELRVTIDELQALSNAERLQVDVLPDETRVLRMVKR
jgi:hypothetical protein